MSLGRWVYASTLHIDFISCIRLVYIKRDHFRGIADYLPISSGLLRPVEWIMELQREGEWIVHLSDDDPFAVF
jgi:hypothetical protein